jgi:flavin-dependent dehydrogenase
MSHSGRVVIVGAGPAGSACAIALNEAGLDVVLCDSGRFSALLTETLHPGIVPLLEILGIAKRFSAAGFLRHRGYTVSLSGLSSFQSYGNGWLGYQVNRPQMRQMLWERARELGVRLLMPVRAQGILRNGRNVCGIETSIGELPASYVIDATGSSRFLCRSVGIDVLQRSKKLIVQYGYGLVHESHSEQSPHFAVDEGCWRWSAPIDEERLHWARLLRTGEFVSPEWIPQDLKAIYSTKLYACDTTWRVVAQPALNGLFTIGDAAGTIDPAAGNGVIRAIMSALMAAHVIKHVDEKRLPLSEGSTAYAAWFHEFYRGQCQALSSRYLQMGIDVSCRMTTAAGQLLSPVPCA